MSTSVVDKNSRVTLHFALKFPEGDVIDSTFEKSPASFVIGDGSLLQGFEDKLLGLSAGESRQFTILPEDAFGQPNPNNVQVFTRQDFSKDMEIAEGLVISFADASQSELPGVVKSIDGDRIEIDFNHPLAGRTILFDVEIIAVEAA